MFPIGCTFFDVVNIKVSNRGNLSFVKVIAKISTFNVTAK